MATRPVLTELFSRSTRRRDFGVPSKTITNLYTHTHTHARSVKVVNLNLAKVHSVFATGPTKKSVMMMMIKDA
jgi:hypothetical protein